jgi:hypothetical protein
MKADRPVGQNLDVTDLQSLVMRSTDNPAHQTFFELDWLRGHCKTPQCVAPVEALLLKEIAATGCRYGTEDCLV